LEELYWKYCKNSLNKSTSDTLSGLLGGDYLLSINTVGQCDNRDTSFVVNAVDIVSANFTSADTTYLNTGALINFNNTSINSISNIWNFGDGFGTSSLLHPNYNYLSAGIYTVSLIATSNSGCLDTAYKSVIVLAGNLVTGIHNNDLPNSFVIKSLGNNIFI